MSEKKKWLVVDAFAHLGAPTNNRYAWSVQSDDHSVTVLTLWVHEIYDDGVTVVADFFGASNLDEWTDRPPNRRRIEHLKHVEEHDETFRVIMVRARDANEHPPNVIARWPEDDLVMTLTAFNSETGEFRAVGHRGSPTAPKWTEDELRACVFAYHKLWAAQEAGERINKAELRRHTVGHELLGRSEGSYERRMQNISAVVVELGMPYVEGYVPLRNIGKPRDQIISLINELWDRIEQPEAPTADPEALETRVSAAMKKVRVKSAVPDGSTEVARVSREGSQFVRDPNVVAWVLNNANGVCEACSNPAPFTRADGTPYLEVHHVRPLEEQGPDTVDNAAALCPNCHRRMHSSNDKNDYRKKLISRVSRIVDHPKAISS